MMTMIVMVMAMVIVMTVLMIKMFVTTSFDQNDYGMGDED